MIQNYPTRLRIVNVVTRGQISSEWSEPLEILFDRISRSKDRLAENYKLKNVDLSGHLTFDLLVDDNEKIISFAGIYNGGRYPEGVYRILNRTWTCESHRVSHGAFPFLASKLILPNQLLRHAADLKLIFLSRQEAKGRLFLKRWVRHQTDAQSWEISNSFVQVAPESMKKSAFHHICFQKLKPIEWSPLNVDESVWKSLPV